LRALVKNEDGNSEYVLSNRWLNRNIRRNIHNVCK